MVVIHEIKEGQPVAGEIPSKAEIKDLNRARAYLADVISRHALPVFSNIGASRPPVVPCVRVVVVCAVCVCVTLLCSVLCAWVFGCVVCACVCVTLLCNVLCGWVCGVCRVWRVPCVCVTL